MNTENKKYKRPYNKTEIEVLKGYKYSYWDHFEHFGMKWIGVTLVLLSPLLIYQKFVEKVSSEIQLVILIPLIIISVVFVVFWMKKMGEIGWNKKVEDEIINGKAEVFKIKTDKVIKRKEIYDLGSGFYVKMSENKTLYLEGQYFDELQYSRKFPNTDFEISRTSLMLNTLLDIQSFGKYLKPYKKLKAFTNEQYKNGEVHYDGDLLNISIDEIK